ncbi:MAG: hypothetical protein U1C19_10455 [Methanobacteriaceae archaeon]|nr:hypothetical protein [Methanobacteriaceae archaeon]
MDADEYQKIIRNLIDFEIEMSSIAKSRQTLLLLHEKREIMLKMKEQINKDIRSTEVHYLSMRTGIREEFCRDNVSKSKRKKLLNKNKSPAMMRAKAMKKLESDRKGKIENYKDIKTNIDDVIVQIEDVMVEVYGSMKSLLGNNE